ncbi:hypothetical protein EGR_08486 [Echinococcus granulosus]|uniref:Uncharacterized protein n=1 Tax=Echinococcus granulosus TaxID=6210 RepID=W6U690_ECHGR|nr:hypothetical protein EGR_08486 [Echinococcus granulosus]EUB56680.1 hypothetical protein EGR_08486 [Echinococcus granulosus]
MSHEHRAAQLQAYSQQSLDCTEADIGLLPSHEANDDNFNTFPEAMTMSVQNENRKVIPC